MMQVTVPPGAAAGQMMQVQLPAGQLVQVRVPAGLQPGQIFQMQVPAAGPVTAEQALAASIAAAGGEIHFLERWSDHSERRRHSDRNYRVPYGREELSASQPPRVGHIGGGLGRNIGQHCSS